MIDQSYIIVCVIGFGEGNSVGVPSEPWEHTFPSSHPSSSSERIIIITKEMQNHMISYGHARPHDPDGPSTRQARELVQGSHGEVDE